MNDPEAMRREIAAREWYHTIELASGAVTPGWFDLRSVAPRLPWPEIRGRRCLDVGTFDGFWAFEMERRGAREVVAIDLLDPRQADWPLGSRQETVEAIWRRKGHGEGFDVAKAALGSAVERRELSVYDLDPTDVGTFDFVYMGSILIHLRDPVRALECVRRVCAGELLSVDTVDPLLTAMHPSGPVASLDAVGRPWWWRPNVAGLRRMVEAAGFSVDRQRLLLMPPGRGQPPAALRPATLRYRAGRTAIVSSRIGDPHVATLAH